MLGTLTIALNVADFSLFTSFWVLGIIAEFPFSMVPHSHAVPFTNWNLDKALNWSLKTKKPQTIFARPWPRRG